MTTPMTVVDPPPNLVGVFTGGAGRSAEILRVANVPLIKGDDPEMHRYLDQHLEVVVGAGVRVIRIADLRKILREVRRIIELFAAAF